MAAADIESDGLSVLIDERGGDLIDGLAARGSGPRRGIEMTKTAVCRALVFGLCIAMMGAAPDNRDDQWPYYGSDQANTHYSRLTQINKGNVANLQHAWTWDVGETPMPQFGTAPSGMEGTPLMIDDVLYISTSFNRVVALDPNTGKEIWTYDPRAYERPGRLDRKSTRLNSSHIQKSRMPSSA